MLSLVMVVERVAEIMSVWMRSVVVMVVMVFVVTLGGGGISRVVPSSAGVVVGTLHDRETAVGRTGDRLKIIIKQKNNNKTKNNNKGIFNFF